MRRDVVVPKMAEQHPRLVGQARPSLDGHDLGAHLGQDRSLVAAAGADLEYPLPGGDSERLRHRCNDNRLRDSLPFLQRQRFVFVGQMA